MQKRPLHTYISEHVVIKGHVIIVIIRLADVVVVKSLPIHTNTKHKTKAHTQKRTIYSTKAHAAVA